MFEPSGERASTSQSGRSSSATSVKTQDTLPSAGFNVAALAKIGEQAFQRGELVSAELVALTYGALVRQLFLDYQAPEDVNEELERIGYNIGLRLVDDFLARSAAPPCRSFQATAEIVARVAFRMYLGVSARPANFAADDTAYSILFDTNPLAEFVEVPDAVANTLWYSNIFCGVIRGALEMVQFSVRASFTRDMLRGDECNEIRVCLLRELEETVPLDKET
jgi:hypothetical protein